MHRHSKISRVMDYLSAGWVAALLLATTNGQEVQHVVVSPVEPYLIPSVAKKSNDVLTQRNNNQRSGTTVWRGLDQASVSNGRFGFIGSIDNLAGVVLAQPLFMESVNFPDGSRSVVFLATSM